MRISTMSAQQSALNGVLNAESNASTTEAHLASGQKLLNASDDPTAAAQVLGLTQISDANTQYQTNITAGTDRLNAEGDALNQVTTILQSARSLALEASNGTETAQDQQAIATQLQQMLDQLVQVANSRDGQGDALFGGNAVSGAPFVQSGNAVSYAGDAGQRMVAAAPGMQVATGDPGSTVFMDIPAGNGQFAVAANAANAGSLVVGQTSVTDPSAFVAGSYKIQFTDTTGDWTATNAAGATVGTGTLSDTGQGTGSIAFGGMQIQVTGQAAAGDSLQVTSGVPQSVFTTFGNLIATLQGGTPGAASSNVINQQLQGIDNALGQVEDVQAQVGARVDTLQQQNTSEGNLGVLYKGDLSNLQDLDMASAISQLDLQTVALQAAQQAFVKVQGLSLFNYLQP
ncbi:MAG TPA: flagellar hook-associated protein FlgL [Rhodanobacteraceae bacterium]|nr:flagellar hook-associated protein FlgL [Rhodanobacteraceae bacterium]